MIKRHQAQQGWANTTDADLAYRYTTIRREIFLSVDGQTGCASVTQLADGKTAPSVTCRLLQSCCLLVANKSDLAFFHRIFFISRDCARSRFFRDTDRYLVFQSPDQHENRDQRYIYECQRRKFLVIAPFCRPFHRRSPHQRHRGSPRKLSLQTAPLIFHRTIISTL